MDILDKTNLKNYPFDLTNLSQYMGLTSQQSTPLKLELVPFKRNTIILRLENLGDQFDSSLTTSV